MTREEFGQKPGINEHPEIRRDFVFTHRNEHAHFYLLLTQNIDKYRDAR